MDYDSIDDSVKPITAIPDTETSASVLPESLPFSAELRDVIDAWPKLPEHMRAAILALAGTVKT